MRHGPVPPPLHIAPTASLQPQWSAAAAAPSPCACASPACPSSSPAPHHHAVPAPAPAPMPAPSTSLPYPQSPRPLWSPRTSGPATRDSASPYARPGRRQRCLSATSATGADPLSSRARELQRSSWDAATPRHAEPYSSAPSVFAPTTAPLAPGPASSWPMLPPPPAHAAPLPPAPAPRSRRRSMSTAIHAPTGPSSLLIAASAGVPPCLPTPTSPAPTTQPVTETVPPAQVMYTHHVAAKTVTCHACQKTMPLSRRPRGSPCAQYTIRTHEQTMQHSISIVAMYLHATACSSADRDPTASTARPPAYAPPPNLARYSGNISITAYEGLLFNPQYRLRTLATGAVQVACLVCKLTLPAHYASAEEAVLSVAAHEGHHDHELAILAASLNVVRHWGRHVRVVESESADSQIMDLVLSDQERAWHSERMVQAAPVPPPPPAPTPVTVAPPPLPHPHHPPQPHATWPSPKRGAACRDVCCVAPTATAYHHHTAVPPQPVSPVTGLMAGVRALSTRGSPQAPTPPSPAPRVLPQHQYHYHAVPAAAAAPAAEGGVARLPPIYAALHVGDGRTPSVPLPRIRIADLLN